MRGILKMQRQQLIRTATTSQPASLHCQSQVRKDSFGEKLLTKGLKISKSVKIKKQTYKLDASASMNEALIIIEGNNITVDFNNAILKGSNLKKNPDEFFGVAVL